MPPVKDTVLSVPTKFGRGETWTLVVVFAGALMAAVTANFEIGAMKERGIAMRQDIAELKRDRDRVTKLEAQISLMFETVKEIRDDLKRRP